MKNLFVSRPLVSASKTRQSPLRAGFTLVEMVLAMGILAILMLAGQSAIRIAGHSLPSSSSPTFSSGNGQRALAQMVSELAYATSVTSMSATSVTFTVAARGTDTAPETICYSWDGVVGDPLNRQYNSDAAVSVVPSVNAFSLLYDKRSATAPTTYATSATATLFSYDPTYSISNITGLSSSMWMSQSFIPTLPSNATSWNITSVKFKACQDNYSGGQFYVQIRPSYASVPGSGVIQQTTFNGSSLPSSVAWQTATFTNPSTLTVGLQAAMTFQWVSNATYTPTHGSTQTSPPGDIAYQTFASTTLPPAYSQNSGSSWNNSTGQGIYCYIYGTYTTPNPTTLNYYLENVRASIQVGSNADATIRTGIPILNQPQVTGP